ncbi:hypothetical protein K431DRAFT_302755 [Polychaeton citri CBS 116435]|uniref:Transcription factor TFIIIC triple barrel domain-containing protein n=1 Tax=Polychaeton citri CBS 116435 TaxID=1314669 RepID=A0A9P4QCR0_9PEZI|nr:hypothetical protein K431DRAFT_302755 [Polychaeton citri CBS 116435]
MPTALAAPPGDSDWEYEYDQSETEDFYFTLDLTTHVPDGRNFNRDGRLKPRRKKAKTLTQPSQTSAGHDHVKQPNLGIPNQGSVQILDLHTEQPIIKLDDDFYTCYWMNDLGTQIYVARPGATDRPLKPGNTLDVLGASQARLLGRPVTLERQPDLPSILSHGNSSVDAIPIDDDDDDEKDGEDGDQNIAVSEPTDSSLPPEPLKVPADRLRNPAMRQQASFMERLSALKIKKGEFDRVPLVSLKGYRPHLVSNRDEMQSAATADADLPADAQRQGRRKRPAEEPTRDNEDDHDESRKKSKAGRKSTAAMRAALGLPPLTSTLHGEASPSPQPADYIHAAVPAVPRADINTSANPPDDLVSTVMREQSTAEDDIQSTPHSQHHAT